LWVGSNDHRPTPPFSRDSAQAVWFNNLTRGPSRNNRRPSHNNSRAEAILLLRLETCAMRKEN
jgi:hypothetical protein